MFQLPDDIEICNENLQLLDLETGWDSANDNVNAVAENGELCINTKDHQLVFKTPQLSSFWIEIKFSETCLYEYNSNFTVLFYYNKRNRQGLEIKVSNSKEQKLTLSLVTLDKLIVKELETVVLDGAAMSGEECHTLTMELGKGIVRGDIGGKPFDFICGYGRVYIAIERAHFIKRCMVKSADLKSGKTLEEETVI